MVRFGDFDLNNENDDFKVVQRRILKVDLHPKYEESRMYFDIAILKFDQVPLTIFVRPGNLSS
jgi:hypothetical protein